MPSRGFPCDFKNEGSTVYMKLPASSLTEFAKAFNDGLNHRGKVLLVLNRKRKMLEVVTRRRFDVLHQKFKT